MSKDYQIDNSGIGGTPYLTFAIDTTADKDFVQDDLDDNFTACVVNDNNSVGMGSDGDKLFGKVVWVSRQLQEGTVIPALGAVQARGVARFKFVENYEEPVLNKGVSVFGDGRVISGDRGFVIAIDRVAGTCDVWLG